jgi:hypothetical protein
MIHTGQLELGAGGYISEPIRPPASHALLVADSNVPKAHPVRKRLDVSRVLCHVLRQRRVTPHD